MLCLHVGGEAQVGRPAGPSPPHTTGLGSEAVFAGAPGRDSDAPKVSCWPLPT